MPADPDSPKTVDVDSVVLPPDGKGKAPTGKNADNSSEISRIIAHWMDEFIRIPGTNVRIGLDPIIGLFPGVGDLLASSVGVVVITEGVRLRVPVSVLFRMGVNVLLNDAIGMIPIVGDLFSVWFKSNSRNLKLLNRWKAGEQAAVRKGSRLFMAGFLIAWIALLGVWLSVWFLIIKTLIEFGTKISG